MNNMASMNETSSRISLKSFEERICKYESDLEELYKSGIEEYQSFVMQLDSELKTKVFGIVELQDSVSQYKERNEESHTRLTALKHDTERLGNSKTTVEKEQVLLVSKLSRLNELISQEICERDEIKSLNEDVRKRMASQKTIHDSVGLFKKYLGLEFRTLKNDRIQFVFHNVIENKPDIVMFVIIKLTNKVYTVLDSEPELNCLKSLEEALNATNNLAGFVQLVRKMLKEEAEKLPE